MYVSAGDCGVQKRELVSSLTQVWKPKGPLQDLHVHLALGHL